MPDMDAALLSAEDMIAAFARLTLSPTEVLQATTDRIVRLNPSVNAFAVLNQDAMRIALESSNRWRAGRPMGPLDGVPCTVKDLVDIAGFPTRRGSRTTSADPVMDDSPLVTGLKAAGAVIIGKTTTTEFGWKSPGDCPLHGITRNPWNPNYTTGGSSSGAGAAGAAGFGPLHVGTDAGGSIRIPAAWCGLVGLKPTYGRVPQWPAGAFASISCAGPMTRTVRDAALMLNVVARYDLRDPFCIQDEGCDWLDGIEAGISGLSVGVLSKPGFDAPVDSNGVAAVEKAAQMLADNGAQVEQADVALPDTSAVFGRVWGAALSRVVKTLGSQVSLLDPGILQVASAIGEMSAVEFMDAESMRAITANAMAKLTQRFDLLLCPTVPAGPPLAGVPIVDPVQALWTDWAPWTFTFNLSRQPAITVPMGVRSDGLPNSVQIAAAQYRDDLVLRAARVIEVSQPFAVVEDMR